MGKETYSIRRGDYIAFPVGPESAHSITNTSEQPLQYLCFSTQHAVEVVGYPDSKKFSFTGRREGQTEGPS